jgi:DNA-binding response OmpR family regulator
MLTIVEDRERGRKLGAADYLVKPIDQENLVALLKQYQAPVLGHALAHDESGTL